MWIEDGTDVFPVASEVEPGQTDSNNNVDFRC